jgi:hypothetical protein
MSRKAYSRRAERDVSARLKSFEGLNMAKGSCEPTSEAMWEAWRRLR